MKRKVIVRAPVLSISGYGENARFVLRALKQYEDYFDIFIDVLNWGRTSWDHVDTPERRWIDSIVQKTFQYMQQGGPRFDMSIQVTIPNEFQQIAPINIGVTAGIESDKIAVQWVEKCNIMDKIITISQHAKDGFEKTSYSVQHQQTKEMINDFRCIKPVYIVEFPVKNVEPVDLGLDFDYDFNFLCIAQWSVRKNLENTIGWFLEQFQDKEVGLILKLSYKNNSIMDRTFTGNKLKSILGRFPNRKCKIYHLHGYLTEEEMQSLYVHPKIKCLISISHGECFCLPAFDAAYRGLPIISTMYGGQKDFLCAPVRDKKAKKFISKPLFSVVDAKIDTIQKEAIWDGVIVADSKWCFPDGNSFKARLGEMVAEYFRFKQQAKKLKAWLSTKFSEEEQNKKFVELILGEKIEVVDIKVLPKLSIISSVYNAAEYIEKFFDNIEQQTMFKEKCELILVHPFSPTKEEEKKIIDKYLLKYPDNIKYINFDEAMTLYACWNVAVRVSTGEIVTNWNLDDRRSLNNFEKCVKELYLNKDIDFVYYDQFITDKANETFDNNSSNGKKYNFPEFNEADGFNTLKMFNFVNHAMSFWRKSLHDKFGLFESQYRSVSDWEFALRCVQKGAKCKKIGDILGLYYFNPTGISTNPENFSWKRMEEKEIYNKYKDLKVEIL